jgi:hypothetical protein
MPPQLKYSLIRSYPKLLDWLKAILLSSNSASSAEWRLLWKRAVVMLLRQLVVGETVEMQSAVAGYLGVDVVQQLPQVQHCQPVFEEARALAGLFKGAVGGETRQRIDAAAAGLGVSLP